MLFYRGILQIVPIWEKKNGGGKNMGLTEKKLAIFHKLLTSFRNGLKAGTGPLSLMNKNEGESRPVPGGVRLRHQGLVCFARFFIPGKADLSLPFFPISHPRAHRIIPSYTYRDKNRGVNGYKSKKGLYNRVGTISSDGIRAACRTKLSGRQQCLSRSAPGALPRKGISFRRGFGLRT